MSPVSSLRTQVLAGSSNWQTQVVGVAPTMPAIRQWPLARGTFFDDGAVRSVAKVCVLGQTVVDDLFPGGEPLGKTVIIRNVPFTIIGVLSRRGQSASGQDQDDVVVIPYTSAMQRLTGQTYLTVIAISANTQADVDPVQDRVARLLEERHHIVPPEQDDFAIRNLQDIAATASSTATVMETLLASVAAVSLLVGGIGIMNIMLVSVTERTREIGLRLAVGARGSAILQQFLAESAVLSTAGGVVGVLLGILGAQIVAGLGHWPASVPAEAVTVAVLFSAAVGVFFGYYPALKAANMDPIEALRSE